MADLEQPVLMRQLGVLFDQRLLFLPGGAGLVTRSLSDSSFACWSAIVASRPASCGP